MILSMGIMCVYFKPYWGCLAMLGNERHGIINEYEEWCDFLHYTLCFSSIYQYCTLLPMYKTVLRGGGGVKSQISIPLLA